MDHAIMRTNTGVLASALVVLAGCTGLMLNQQTLFDKPTGYLCRLPTPEYVALPSGEVEI
jgi:hypothetical protein